MNKFIVKFNYFYQVCQGDLVIITVMNMLHSDTFSIHWHGLLQRGTNYMDGVPHVTQCPITPMAGFRYTFWADDVGTYFYHSHSGKKYFLINFHTSEIYTSKNERILRYAKVHWNIRRVHHKSSSCS